MPAVKSKIYKCTLTSVVNRFSRDRFPSFEDWYGLRGVLLEIKKIWFIRGNLCNSLYIGIHDIYMVIPLLSEIVIP